jgi:Holliday junction resolvasome RuvABC DNA-binding subunit
MDTIRKETNNEIFDEINNPDFKEEYHDILQYKGKGGLMEYIYAPVTDAEGKIIDDERLEAIHNDRLLHVKEYIDYISCVKSNIRKGIKKAAAEIVMNMQQLGYPVKEIAKYIRLTEEQVMEIIEEQNDKIIEKTQDEIYDEKLEARRLIEKRISEEVKDYRHGGKSAEYKGREKMVAKFVISLVRLGYRIDEISKCVMQPRNIVREIIERQTSVMILGLIERADNKDVNKIFYKVMGSDIKDDYREFRQYKSVGEYICASETSTSIIDEEKIEEMRYTRAWCAMWYMNYRNRMKYAIREGISEGRTLAAIEINMKQLGYSAEEIAKVVEMTKNEEV